MTRLRILVSLILAVSLASTHAEGKYAICVGVNQYQHDSLSPLKVAEKDATVVHRYLKSQGFASELRVGSDATKSSIESAITSQLAKFRAGDTVIVFLAGHGLQFANSGDGYFCPVDAKPFADNSNTLISLKWVYDELQKSYRGVKLLWVDACRNDPSRRVRRRGLDSSVKLQPPAGVSALFACSPGQQSFENGDHGIFTQSLLEGLRDGLAADRQNRVTWDSLKAYVKERTEILAATQGSRQTPEERTGGLVGVPTLATVSGASNKGLRKAMNARPKQAETKEAEPTPAEPKKAATRRAENKKMEQKQAKEKPKEPDPPPPETPKKSERDQPGRRKKGEAKQKRDQGEHKLNVFEQDLANAINAARTQRGLRPLKIDLELSGDCRSHAIAMGKIQEVRDEFDVPPGDRIKRHFTSVGKWGITNGQKQTVTEIVEEWTNSTIETHNILCPEVTHLGVGSIATKGKRFFAALYAEVGEP